MAKHYNIIDRIANGNQKPVVKIDDTHEYKINTGKSAVLVIKNLSEDKDKDAFEIMDSIIKVALGKEAFDYIEEQDFTFENLQLILNAIMAGINSKEIEEIEEEAKKEQEKKS